MKYQSADYVSPCDKLKVYVKGQGPGRVHDGK
jgi:hypothetical protein